MSDSMRDIFELIRLKSAVYFVHDFVAPWGMKIPKRHNAQFVVVVRGVCTISILKNDIIASSGDIVLFPTGIPHSISDGTKKVIKPGPPTAQAIMRGESPFGEGQLSARILMGHFEYDKDARHPMLEGLPEVVHLPSLGNPDAGTPDLVFPLLISEMSIDRPGSQAIIERLAEIALVQIFRTIGKSEKFEAGFLAALSDRQLSKAIAAIHQRFGEVLTIEDLAKEAGMSRSSFASRFMIVAKTSPANYLSQWRLLQARKLLASTHALNS